MELILAGLVAVIVFCSYLIFDTVRVNTKRRQSLRDRITPDGSTYSAEEEQNAPTDYTDYSDQAKSIAGLMRSLGIKVDEALRPLELRMARAGIESKDGPIYFLLFQKVLGPVFAIFCLYLLVTASGDSKTMGRALGVLILILSVYGPKLYLQNKIDHRNKKLQRAFPDTLDLLLICVESGLALDAALNRVCNELARAYPEMTSELNRTRLELALLNDRVKALMNLGDRTEMVAFRSLVVALVQSERFGTSLTDTLRVLSEDFRLQRLATAESKAARLPVLMTVPLIFLLMPAFMMIILGPAIVTMTTKGHEVTGK